jgi:hypothetical protein
MGDEPENKGGRPGAGPRYPVEIRTMDAVTSRMLDTLVTYGRFGDSRSQVALFIIRKWLFENEDRLQKAIAARKFPLGDIDSDFEPPTNQS